MGSNTRSSDGTDATLEEESAANTPFASNPNITNAAIRGANVSKQRNVLGRGLQALMSSSAVPIDLRSLDNQRAQQDSRARSSGPANAGKSAEFAQSEEPLEGGLTYLSIDRVTANKAQPRQHFAPDEIARLTESIRKTGLLQPIVVRRKPGEAGAFASYEIVAGERRYRAAKEAGLAKIPAILKNLSDREALELGLVENVQRADLNPIEEAKAYQRLISDYGATQADVAETVGRDRASVANALRLLRLPTEVQERLVSGAISAGHGRALLVLSSEAEQLAVCLRILQEGLSVRAVEELVGKVRGETGKPLQKGRQQKASRESQKAPSVSALEDQLRRSLGTKVALNMNEQGEGEIRIQFYSRSELDRILEKMSL